MKTNSQSDSQFGHAGSSAGMPEGLSGSRHGLSVGRSL